MPRLVLSPRAQLDLAEIGDYIARDNLARAMSFLDELKAHCERISEAPDAYPRREDLGVGIRMAVHGRYLILFRSDTNGARRTHPAQRAPTSA